VLTLGFPALILSLGCAAAFAGADYFRKAIPLSVPLPLALFYLFGLEMPVLGGWMLASGDIRLTADYLVPGLAAAAIGLGANVLFIVALRRSPLSLMIPLMALIPVATTLLSGVLLHEWPRPLQTAGIIIVVLGLFILYVPFNGGFHPLAVWRNFAREPGAIPMIGVVALWSLSPPIDKICVAHASVGMHGLLQLVFLCSVMGAWLTMRGGRQALVLPRATLKPLFLAAMAGGFGYALQLAAFKIAPVGIVELFKRSIGLISALALGRALLQERVTGPTVAAITVMAVGLALILVN
jgi:drug/metabolite transporter (DMT)-like permease